MSGVGQETSDMLSSLSISTASADITTQVIQVVLVQFYHTL